MNSHIYNAKYKAEVAKYGRKDAIIALCYVVYVCAMSYFLVPSHIASNIIVALDFSAGLGTIGLNILFNFTTFIVMLAPFFVYMLITGQKLASIGFRKKHLGAALCLGLAFSAIALVLTYRGLLPGLIQGGQLNSFGILMLLLLQTLLAAAWEDILFSGYIQTRLYGLIRHDVLAVFIGAVLFGAMHIPSRVPQYGLSALGGLVSLEMIGWIGMHSVWNLLFRRHFSIFPVIMMHTFWNMAQARLWADPLPPGLNETASFAIIILAAGIWAFYTRRKGKKASAS